MTRVHSDSIRERGPARLSAGLSRGQGPSYGAAAGAREPGALSREAVEPADVSEAVLDAVCRFPGLTCEGVAHVTTIATDRVKPHLAVLTESGQLRKVGRTRGTRYPSGLSAIRVKRRFVTATVTNGRGDARAAGRVVGSDPEELVRGRLRGLTPDRGSIGRNGGLTPSRGVFGENGV